MSNRLRRVNSNGILDHIEVNDRILTISGWVASKDAGPVTGFYVTVDGTMCAITELILNLPSDDVNNLLPEMDNSGHCRFKLCVV